MAGKGYKEAAEDQGKQSIHFRLENASWASLDQYCVEKRIKKQALFEFLTRAIIMRDHRIEQLVEEAMDDKRKRRGLDEIDIKQIQEILRRGEMNLGTNSGED